MTLPESPETSWPEPGIRPSPSPSKVPEGLFLSIPAALVDLLNEIRYRRGPDEGGNHRHSRQREAPESRQPLGSDAPDGVSGNPDPAQNRFQLRNSQRLPERGFGGRGENRTDEQVVSTPLLGLQRFFQGVRGSPDDQLIAGDAPGHVDRNGFPSQVNAMRRCREGHVQTLVDQE